MRTISIVLAAISFLTVTAAKAADDLVEDTNFLNVTIKGKRVRLEALVVRRADDAGRRPIALIAHGKRTTHAQMRDQHPADLAPQARDLARRGWLVVVVMRRGFGASDGPHPVQLSCKTRSLRDRFNADADDLQATVVQISRRPDADAGRMIAIGVSAGGPAVTALAARNPPGLAGIINVSGGIRLASCPKEDALVAAFAEYGAKIRIPNLWMYAKNDELFPPHLVERMRTAFLAGGGDVRLVMFEPEGKDGHHLFSAGRMKWLPEMDSFLRLHGLPTWTWVDIDELMKRLDAGRSLRGFVERYVAAPTEKAMARAVGKSMYYQWHGSQTLEAAKKSVLEMCHQKYPSCALVMENGQLLNSTRQDVRAETIEAVRLKIRRFWTPPVDSADVVHVLVKLKPGGFFQETPIVLNSGDGEKWERAKRSVLQALEQAEPLEVLDGSTIGTEIEISFDPQTIKNP